MLVDGFDLYRILKLSVATRSFCQALSRHWTDMRVFILLHRRLWLSRAAVALTEFEIFIVS